MQRRFFSLILLSFLLSACVQHSPPQAIENLPSVKIKQTKKVASFNQVEIQGQISATLHTGYKKPHVILSGDTRDLAAINTIVTDDTLYLILGKGYPKFGPVHADIRGHFLNRVVAKEATQIIGKHLHTSILDLYLEHTGNVTLDGTIGLRVLDIKGNNIIQIRGIRSHNLQLNLQENPKVQLSGIARLTHLNIDGNAWLRFPQVKTDNLIIRTKQSPTIQLAGTVNKLDAEFGGYTRFKGRYLRAQRSFVKTYDHAVAEISVAKHQSNLASGSSDIYYYNLPDTRADFMAYDGSVLDIREWNQKDLKDFDRYNKQVP